MRYIKRFYPALGEGINDKNLFKAVIMAGGPGSGKSFIAGVLFGVTIGNVSPFGVKVVNSDDILEYELKKAGLPLVFDVEQEEIYAQQIVVRNLSKGFTDKKLQMHINGMLPLLIDGTGKDYAKIRSKSDRLRDTGYDTAMVFVDTTLEVSQKRNLERERQVDPLVVEEIWNGVQRSKPKYQNYFGKDFHYLANNVYYPKDTPEAQRLMDELWNLGKSVMEEPLRNPIGEMILNVLRKKGGKYMSDLLPDERDI